MTALWVGAGWLAGAFALALIVGKGIRMADEIDAALSDYQVELPAEIAS